MRLPCLSLLLIGLCAGCGKADPKPSRSSPATDEVARPAVGLSRKPVHKLSEEVRFVLPEDVDVYSRPKVMLSPDGQHYACLYGRSRVLSAAEMAAVQKIVSGKRLSAEYLKNYEAGGMSAFVAVDGQKHFPVNHAWGGFSPDSRRFGYHAKNGVQYARDRNGQTRQVATDFIVVDGQPASSNYFSFPQPPQFSPDGEVWAAVGEKSLSEREKVMIVNGQEIGWVTDGGQWDGNSYLLFSPAGHDYLFVTRTNQVQNAGQTHYSRMVSFNGRQKWVYSEVDRPRFTRDGRHWGFLATKDRLGDAPVLVVDGQETPLNLAADERLASLAPLPNLLLGRDTKHILYLTCRKSGQPMWAWWKGQRGKSYTRINDPILSPDGTRMAYKAENNKVQQLVVDGEEKNWGQPIFGGGGVFSPDSKRIACVIAVGSGEKPAAAVVVDGIQQKTYASIYYDSLKWSPDSQRVVYLAKEKDQWWLVADHTEQPLPRQVEAFESRRLIFSADSTRVALVGKYYTNAFWAEIGYVSPMYKDVLDFAFSPDGRHQACVVTEGHPSALDYEIRWTVIVDRTHKQTYDRVWDSEHSSVQTGRWVWTPPDQRESSGLIPRLLWWTDSRQLCYWVLKGRNISTVTHTVEVE